MSAKASAHTEKALQYLRNPTRIPPRFFGGIRGTFEFGREGCDLVRECRLRLDPGPPFSVNVRSLGNQSVVLRRGTSDCAVAWDAFVGRYHLPPRLLRAPEVIWDLGSNIGLTVAHYAHLFPDAQIHGVEASEASFLRAESNTQPWRARVNLTQCAAWYEDGPVGFAANAETAAAGHIDPSGRVVEGRSLNSMLADCERIDFMKMDIEGAEREVLQRNTEWAARVGCLKVEVHAPYSLTECCRDLETLGFRAKVYRRRQWTLIGMRSWS